MPAYTTDQLLAMPHDDLVALVETLQGALALDTPPAPAAGGPPPNQRRLLHVLLENAGKTVPNERLHLSLMHGLDAQYGGIKVCVHHCRRFLRDRGLPGIGLDRATGYFIRAEDAPAIRAAIFPTAA